MIMERTCRECAKLFQGGPRAYYCPVCRVDRQRNTWREFRRRKRVGDVRPIGSTDKCECCRKSYVVNGGNQRFCPDCQPIHAAEYDRKTSLPFYHEHKETINPARNERRRVGVRNCDWCGKEYTQTDASLTCGDPVCRRLLKNRKWREGYKKRKDKNNPAQH